MAAWTLRILRGATGAPALLRRHIVVLVVGVLLPVVAFSAAIVWRLSAEDVARAKEAGAGAWEVLSPEC